MIRLQEFDASHDPSVTVGDYDSKLPTTLDKKKETGVAKPAMTYFSQGSTQQLPEYAKMQETKPAPGRVNPQSPVSYKQSQPFNLDIMEQIDQSPTSTAYDLVQSPGLTIGKKTAKVNQFNFGGQVSLKTAAPLKGINIQTQAKAKEDTQPTEPNPQWTQEDSADMMIKGTNPFRKAADASADELDGSYVPQTQYFMNHYGVVKMLTQSLSSQHSQTSANQERP